MQSLRRLHFLFKLHIKVCLLVNIPKPLWRKDLCRAAYADSPNSLRCKTLRYSLILYYERAYAMLRWVKWRVWVGYRGMSAYII